MPLETKLNQSTKQEQVLSFQMLQSLNLLNMNIKQLNSYVNTELKNNPVLQRSEEYGEYEEDKKQKALENISLQETLSDHLSEQLSEIPLEEPVKKACELLIGNLDKNGFFLVPLNVLFEKTDINKNQIEKAVSTVRSFDPAGICVADYKESLILQAKLSSLDEESLSVFTELVKNCMQLLSEGKIKETAEKLGVSVDTVEDLFELMKTFTPFPGRAFDSSNDNNIFPEFSVHVVDGEIVLVMNNELLPDLKISPEYISGNQYEKDEKIKEKIRSAKMLITQLSMRYNTIFNAANALVNLQKDFFMNGPKFLKTMTREQLALLINVHESTVSRLVQNKYVETDWGLLPLKYFFSQGVSNVSRTSVKTIIFELLSENSALTDREISEKLAKQDIQCARRTVAKYRNELGLPSKRKNS